MNQTEITTFYWIAFVWLPVDLTLNKRSFTIKWFGQTKTGLEIQWFNHWSPDNYMHVDLTCCVVLRRSACLPCFISRWHLSRFYLTGNFDNQPRNLYFQPCENIMYKKIKIVPAVTKYVTGMPFTCLHCMCILLMPLCWEVKMSNKRNHNPISSLAGNNTILPLPKKMENVKNETKRAILFF